jgi:hypothetical protein
MRKRVYGGMVGVLSGVALALVPLLASAQQPASRALSPGSDWRTVVMVTAGIVLGLMLLATIGYLYRRERRLEWEFQQAELPAEDGAHH